MAPKRSASGGSKRASKRIRSSIPQIGASTAADDTARLIASHHLAEHAGGGANYLSVRRERHAVESLKESSLHAAARAIFDAIRFRAKDVPGGVAAKKNSVGWDPNRDPSNQAEILASRHCVHELSEDTADRLLSLVLYHSYTALQVPNDPGVSVVAIASIFFQDRISRLSLSSLSAPSILLNQIPQCTALVELDLSHSPTLSDAVLAKVLSRIPSLQKINLKACTKVGDNSIKALATASGACIKSTNLSFTAVGTKGLGALLGHCPRLEVLKLEAVGNLNEKNVNLIVETATNLSNGTFSIPLSNLRTLKLKNTLVTDAALGRLLTLCAPTLARLDVSYTQLKSLDIVSSALHTLPIWNLEKLVASGLPLTPASIENFFEPLAQHRTREERDRFRVVKLGSIPATSTKAPGITDAVLARLLPHWENLKGLDKVSLYGNLYLAKTTEPMYSFLSKIGSRCRDLNLTNIPVDSYHLEGLLEPVTFDADGGDDHVLPTRLETLVLDSTKIDDRALLSLGTCRKLRALHVAETRITPTFLDGMLKSCPDLSVLNLTSCRGIPVTQRRTFFDSYEKGQVET